jgi:hypothetical protein
MNKFRVVLSIRFSSSPWPNYWRNFYYHCSKIANDNNWAQITVINHQLKQYGGRFIQTRTQGSYLRWDNEASHTAFVLKWS